MIDLRSDTVTLPSKEMMEAMRSAPVGDDVFAEDPTVNIFEERCALLFGKEAAVFCPSGTMTNQLALNVHTRPGDEVICDRYSHIYLNEGGGLARNSGVQVRLISGVNGKISAEQVVENINPLYDWLPRTSLVSLENTVNRAGGSYYKLETIQEIYQAAKQNNLNVHIDGARIFNALVETRESTTEYGKCFDSISVCFSKGLGCPVGSVLVGSKEFIKEARRVRKSFGGGMRQAGFLAAAGIYALDHNISRLKDDHVRAKKLEEVLKTASFVEELIPVETNIIIFSLTNTWTGESFLKKLAEKGIKGIAFGPKMIRFVTHLDFDNVMLEKTLKTLKEIK